MVVVDGALFTAYFRWLRIGVDRERVVWFL